MFLIVGLGNPGTEHKNTRHNVGFAFADNAASYYNFFPPRSRFKSEVSEGLIDGQKILLQKPMTYMNLSGSAVLSAVSFYKIPLENIIVIHDDIDLDVGKIRVKVGGGAGGHNGLKDIDAKIGKEYTRVRIGIGHPGNKDMVSGYVLSRFGKEDRQVIDEIVDDTVRNIGLVLDGDSNRFTTNVARPSVVKPPPEQ